MKDNDLYEVVDEHAAPQHRYILCDQDIRLAGASPAAVKCLPRQGFLSVTK
jgi:hypothetical protein